jgi:pyridoxamine 5'-phosphate oxidase
VTLDEVLAEAFALISRGVADRRHAFHTPTLATIGRDGAPEARTLVLRAFDPAGRRIRLHTDRRAGKVAEIAAEPRCALHFYDAKAGLQLRLGGRARVHAGDAIADAAWAGSRAMSRMCYAVEPAPGSPVPAPPPAPQDPEAGRPNFAVILLRFDRLELLDLAATGHRRARFDWRDGVQSATWLVP